ncbi:sensor histidine kinase, partial [Micromonospora zhanjiangensis]
MSRSGRWPWRRSQSPAPDRHRPPDLAGRPDNGGSSGGGGEFWREIAEQYALRVMAAAYLIGEDLDAVEADERDPARLERLYRIDHANSRIRRQAENLQVLAGRKVDDAGRQVTTLIDVIRASTSTIEHYQRVAVSRVAELAVVEFAADDVIRLLTELLDNATRFSPPKSIAAVSATLTESGSVLIRIEDQGIGLRPEQLDRINAMLAGQLDPLRGGSAAHLGLAVVQRLSLAHRIGVRLHQRHGAGTLVTVVLPESVLCAPPPPSGPV